MEKRLAQSFRTVLAASMALCILCGAAGASPNPGISSPEKEGKECCAFSLHFVNLYYKPIVKKIRVSGTCDTQICCADPDKWQQTSDITNSIDWQPTGGAMVPYGNAIDNDFVIYLDGPSEPYTLQVEFFDANDQVMCRQTISIFCSKEYDENQDWTVFTSRTGLDDSHLFAFAVRENEDDGDEEDSEFCSTEKIQVPCTFESSITCSGTDVYHVTLQGPGNFTEFNWDVVSGPATPTISSNQNPVMDLTLGGSYIITLMACNPGVDTCFTSNEVIIPSFTPVVQHIRLPCSYQIQFTASGAADLGSVAEYQWEYQGNTIGTGNPFTYDFGGPGTYTVAMIIVDNYGCIHPIPYQFVISDACTAQFEVDHYVLCPDCTSPANVTVYFNNLSEGGLCPINYLWTFGDGQTGVSTHVNSQISHTYSVQDCKARNTFDVTLRMIDSSQPIPCTTYMTHQIIIEPCNPEFSYVACPDGKVILTATVPGFWVLPPGVTIAPWPYSSNPLPNGSQSTIVALFPAGTWPVTFTSHCTTGGECTKTNQVVVSLECCAKNDSKRPDAIEFTAGGSDYRMKHNFVQRQLPFIHHIKVKTKLKKRKTIFGIAYWKGTKADEIEASHNGSIFMSDVVCNCKIEQQTSNQEIKYNKTKAKYRTPISGRFRSKVNSLESYHRVVKDGETRETNLYLGNDCDEFRWYTDWF